MDTTRFEEEFPSLSGALLEFQYNTEHSDEEIARRPVKNPYRNSREQVIAGARFLVEESALVLRDFDRRWPEFADLIHFETKEDGRAWLTKMNGLWKKTLQELESKD